MTEIIVKVFLFVVSVYSNGIAFFVSPFRPDERPWFKDGLGLLVNDSDGRLQDGVYEAYERIKIKGRTFHDLKNISFEWLKSDPKRANKFYCFVILLLSLLHLL